MDATKVAKEAMACDIPKTISEIIEGYSWLVMAEETRNPLKSEAEKLQRNEGGSGGGGGGEAHDGVVGTSFFSPPYRICRRPPRPQYKRSIGMLLQLLKVSQIEEEDEKQDGSADKGGMELESDVEDEDQLHFVPW